MPVKLRGQLAHRLVALQCRQRDFRFECRAVVPSWAACHLRSFVPARCRIRKGKSNQLTCSVFPGHLYTVRFAGFSPSNSQRNEAFQYDRAAQSKGWAPPVAPRSTGRDHPAMLSSHSAVSGTLCRFARTSRIGRGGVFIAISTFITGRQLMRPSPGCQWRSAWPSTSCK